MDVIFAKIILEEEGREIIRKDLINEGYDCEIFVNEIRFSYSMKLKKENYIIYIFKEKYDNLKDLFRDCTLLTSINLSNINTKNVTNMDHMLYNCSSLTSLNLTDIDTCY